jgi:hypothetical protein
VAAQAALLVLPEAARERLATQNANGRAIEPRKKKSLSFHSEHASSCPHVKSARRLFSIEPTIARNHDQRFFWISSSFVRNKVLCLIGPAAQLSE